MNIDFYDTNNNITESASLDPKEGMFDLDIPVGQLHIGEVLDYSTKIFERKERH